MGKADAVALRADATSGLVELHSDFAASDQSLQRLLNGTGLTVDVGDVADFDRALTALWALQREFEFGTTDAAAHWREQQSMAGHTGGCGQRRDADAAPVLFVRSIGWRRHDQTGHGSAVQAHTCQSDLVAGASAAADADRLGTEQQIQARAQGTRPLRVVQAG